MPRALIQFNDYVSLAIMLLMLVALIGGRSAATELAIPAEAEAKGMTIPFTIEIDGHIGDQALKVGLAIAGEVSQFRGEDE